MFTRLTIQQESLLRSIMKDATEVYFYGIDQNELPVVGFKDARRTTKPFALLRRMSRQLTQLQPPEYTTNSAPAYPLRWFTEEELDAINPEHHELLLSLERG